MKRFKQMLKDYEQDYDKSYVLLSPDMRKDITDRSKKVEVWEWTPTHLHFRFEGEPDIYLPIVGVK